MSLVKSSRLCYSFTMKVLNYTVYLQRADEGGFIVSAPALPGCRTQGDTKEEALAMIKDAIEGYIISLRKHGEPIPTDKAEIEKVSVQV